MYLIGFIICGIFRFDSKLHEYIEPKFATAESKLDSRIQRNYCYYTICIDYYKPLWIDEFKGVNTFIGV